MEFRLEQALERRDPSSVITAVALDDDGGRIYVGTSDGVLEEWNRPAGGGRAVLGARRHVGGSKKPVAAISYVGAARKLATLVDGNVFLLDEETLDSVPLPVEGGWRSGGGGVASGVGSVVAASGLISGSSKEASAVAAPAASSNTGGITALVAAPPGGQDAVSASCLAVAGRARGRLLSGVGGGTGSRAAVFFVFPGKGSNGSASSSSTNKSSPPAAVCAHSVEWGEPLAVTTVAWAGRGALVLGSALRYSLWKLPPLSLSAAAAAAASGAPSSPSSAVVPLLELSADAPAATPVALSLPSLSPVSLSLSPRARPRRRGEEEEATTTKIPTAVLLLVERAGVAVGADGMPARGRPGAATFAEAPTALATVAGGLAVAAACPTGVLLHDAVTGARLGFLGWPRGATPARGQRLLAASLASSSPSASPCRASSFALLSGMRRAWTLVPVSARERAVAALNAWRLEEAAAAALSSLGGGAGAGSGSDNRGSASYDEQEEGEGEEGETSYSWQEDVAAEAGLALLVRALSSFSPPPSPSSAFASSESAAAASAATTASSLIGEALSASSLHPTELFPLLPGESAPWAREAERAAAASADRRRGRLREGATAAAAAATTLSPSPPPLLLPPLAPGEQNAAVTAEVSRAMLALRKRMMKKRNVDESLREAVDTVAVVLAARAAGEEGDEQGGEIEIDGGDKSKSKAHHSSLAAPPLSLSSLLRSPSLRARMSVISPSLEAAGEHAALAAALARASGGAGAAAALRVWREVAEGKRKVKRGGEGGAGSAAAAALAAAEAAADLLSDRERASAALVTENVPWLLSAGRERKKASSSVAAGGGRSGAGGVNSSSSSSPAAFSSLFSSSVSPSAVLEEWTLPPAARALFSRRRRTNGRHRRRTTAGGGGRETRTPAAAVEEEEEKEGDESEDESIVSTERALRLLPAGTAPEARAAYLVHLMFGAESGGEGGGRESRRRINVENESGTTKTEATELALLLVSIAASLLPPTASAGGKCLFPDWKRAEAVRAWLGAPPSAKEAEEEKRERHARARRALRALLLSQEISPSSPFSFDLASISSALSQTDLWEERAAAELAGGDREAAARTLLLVCRDPEAAVEVSLIRRFSSFSSSSSASSNLLTPDALLSMLLNPGGGRAPLLEDAVALLDCVTGMTGACEIGGGGERGGMESDGRGGPLATAATTSFSPPRPSPPPQRQQHPPPLLLPPLDASSILSAMGDSTPLCQVQPLLRRLLRARVRGRRAATFAKALARAEALGAAAEKSLIATRKAATVDEGRSCRGCGAKIGLKVFAVVPVKGGAGAISCMWCAREGKANER